VKAFVDRGKEFEGKLQPGLAREDGVRSVEWGGKGLAGSAKAVKGDMGHMGVGDRVMIEGVGDDDGGGFSVADEVGAEILEGEQLCGEAGIGEGEVVVQSMDVTHDGERRRGTGEGNKVGCE